MTSHIINALLLAGASLLFILTGAISIYAKRSARRDKARCNYRVGDVYHEVLPSTGCEDLYRVAATQIKITGLAHVSRNRKVIGNGSPRERITTAQGVKDPRALLRTV